MCISTNKVEKRESWHDTSTLYIKKHMNMAFYLFYFIEIFKNVNKVKNNIILNLVVSLNKIKIIK